MSKTSEPKGKRQMAIPPGDPEVIEWLWTTEDASALTTHWKAEHPRGIDVPRWKECAECVRLIDGGDSRVYRRPRGQKVALNIHRTRSKRGQ